jgi:hypothetical protein
VRPSDIRQFLNLFSRSGTQQTEACVDLPLAQVTTLSPASHMPSTSPPQPLDPLPLQAVRVALHVKKYLVDHRLVHVPQPAFRHLLLLQLCAHGYADVHITRYLLISRFFAQRDPLAILIGGPPCALKTALAQALAAQVNMPNVQQADILYRLMHVAPAVAGDGAAAAPPQPLPPLWERGCHSEGAVLAAYHAECRLVRRALQGDLCKAVVAGKAVIVEGMHVDPGMFLHEFGVLDTVRAWARSEVGGEQVVGQGCTPVATVTRCKVRCVGHTVAVEGCGEGLSKRVCLMLRAPVATGPGAAPDGVERLSEGALAKECDWFAAPTGQNECLLSARPSALCARGATDSQPDMSPDDRISEWLEYKDLASTDAAACVLEPSHVEIPSRERGGHAKAEEGSGGAGAVERSRCGATSGDAADGVSGGLPARLGEVSRLEGAMDVGLRGPVREEVSCSVEELRLSGVARAQARAAAGEAAGGALGGMALGGLGGATQGNPVATSWDDIEEQLGGTMSACMNGAAGAEGALAAGRAGGGVVRGVRTVARGVAAGGARQSRAEDTLEEEEGDAGESPARGVVSATACSGGAGAGGLHPLQGRVGTVASAVLQAQDLPNTDVPMGHAGSSVTPTRTRLSGSIAADDSQRRADPYPEAASGSARAVEAGGAECKKAPDLAESFERAWALVAEAEERSDHRGAVARCIAAVSQAYTVRPHRCRRIMTPQSFTD